MAAPRSFKQEPAGVFGHPVAGGPTGTATGGLGMQLNQGIIGIQPWTGRDPRAEVMRRALEGAFRA